MKSLVSLSQCDIISDAIYVPAKKVKRNKIYVNRIQFK